MVIDATLYKCYGYNPFIVNYIDIKPCSLHFQINYWKEVGEDETMSLYRPIPGQTDNGFIIGLDIKTYYYVNVQVYNSAGNGPKSEDFLEETLRSGKGSIHLFKWLKRMWNLFKGYSIIKLNVYRGPGEIWNWNRVVVGSGENLNTLGGVRVPLITLIIVYIIIMSEIFSPGPLYTLKWKSPNIEYWIFKIKDSVTRVLFRAS